MAGSPVSDAQVTAAMLPFDFRIMAAKRQTRGNVSVAGFFFSEPLNQSQKNYFSPQRRKERKGFSR
jgi:hypothetical protein